MAELDSVRSTAQAILDRLSQSVPGWRILSIDSPQDRPVDADIALYSVYTGPRPHPLRTPPNPIRVTVGLSDEESWSAHFLVGVEWQDATAQLASQIQDHAIEYTQGAAIPPCPVHPQHPLSAKVLSGIACWSCPKNPGFYSEPIAEPSPGDL